MFVQVLFSQPLKKAWQSWARSVSGVLRLGGSKLVLGLSIACSAICHGL